ncbi:MAG: anti-sigma factor antagonist [Clostridia bacterium]|nr:anti-sigma factor antagonist [Clostridia bacterium]
MPKEIRQDARFVLSDRGDEILFLLSGEIDHHAAKGLREAIDGEIRLKQPKKVTLNFTKVGFMDSSGLGLVLGRYRTCQSIGAAMTVVSGNPTCRRIFDMAGLSRVEGLNVEQTERR